jgi:hypothetical protein
VTTLREFLTKPGPWSEPITDGRCSGYALEVTRQGRAIVRSWGPEAIRAAIGAYERVLLRSLLWGAKLPRPKGTARQRRRTIQRRMQALRRALRHPTYKPWGPIQGETVEVVMYDEVVRADAPTFGEAT